MTYCKTEGEWLKMWEMIREFRGRERSLAWKLQYVLAENPKMKYRVFLEDVWRELA